jgi:hypothetical protein
MMARCAVDRSVVLCLRSRAKLCTFHDGHPALQQLTRDARRLLRRYAQERDIHLLQTAHVLGNPRMRECRRQGCARAAHDADEFDISRRGNGGRTRSPQPAEADDRDP